MIVLHNTPHLQPFFSLNDYTFCKSRADGRPGRLLDTIFSILQIIVISVFCFIEDKLIQKQLFIIVVTYNSVYITIRKASKVIK